jgi:hypothetical protein
VTPEETGKLLGICAAYDRRTVGEADVIAWYRVTGDLPYTGCEAAVIAWYTTHREWIMPADIRGAVKRAQHAAEDHASIGELLDPAAYQAKIAAADSAFLRKLAARTGQPVELNAIEPAYSEPATDETRAAAAVRARQALTHRRGDTP